MRLDHEHETDLERLAAAASASIRGNRITACAEIGEKFQRVGQPTSSGQPGQVIPQPIYLYWETPRAGGQIGVSLHH
jgi:hypothetical protein